MQERLKAAKSAVNLSIDAELIEEAKAAGINLSAALERELRSALHERRERSWREQNRAAIDASNQELAANGLWCDHHRDW